MSPRNVPGGSGGAIYLTGGLKLSTSELSYNTAGIGGVAISSVCASSRVEFEGVFFEDNGMFCPVGQYEPININSVRNICKLNWNLEVVGEGAILQHEF